MLVKPATPLTAILLAAFVLLLLSVLSTPVVKSIPLATFQDVSFGVFGYCRGSDCSGFRVGYKPDGLFSDSSNDGQFNLPADIRSSLSSLLVVHPVAALLTFVCLGLAAAAHLHSPSHSPRYLLGLLILLLPTLLVSLLAFLVDILLFVPHVQWGGWIVLGATILVTASGVMTCAMRRTLVSRKARKRRIAENAEMSGENYYNRQNAIKLDPPGSSHNAATTTTTITATNSNSNNANGSTPPVPAPPDSLPAFATFDSRARSPDNDQRPLNSQTPPPGFAPDPSSPYGPPPASQRSYGRDYGGGGGGPPPRGGPYGMAGAPRDPRLREQASNGSMGSQGRGRRGPRPPFPPGRGGGRGRGGMPPPGFNGRGRGGMPGRGRMPPPSGYPPREPPNMDMYSDGGYGGYPAPRPPPPPASQGPRYGAAADPYGPDRRDSPGNLQSPSSVYSQETYQPPRNNWNRDEPTLPNVAGVSPARSPPPQPRSPLNPNAGGADNRQAYFEDVDPRFAQPAPVESADVPSALTPGQHGEPQPSTIIPPDDPPDRPRSPASSDTSHFTSISQRGINPRWRPPESESAQNLQRALSTKQERQDALLGNNPDFELPAAAGRGRGRGRGRMPAMPVIPGTPTPPAGTHRYP